MASWIPSDIGKKLLRYVLSRFELLDSESMDLEKLDLAIGMRNSVELRHVRLRVDVRYGDVYEYYANGFVLEIIQTLPSP